MKRRGFGSSPALRLRKDVLGDAVISAVAGTDSQAACVIARRLGARLGVLAPSESALVRNAVRSVEVCNEGGPLGGDGNRWKEEADGRVNTLRGPIGRVVFTGHVAGDELGSCPKAGQVHE